MPARLLVLIQTSLLLLRLNKVVLMLTGCIYMTKVERLLTSSVGYDKVLCKFGEQQLDMVNYACGFNQSETGEHFE